MSQIFYSRVWVLDIGPLILQQQLCCAVYQPALIPQAFSGPGAPAQCWHKCLCSHRMDWIDDLIYGKLPLQKMFELFYSWINSAVQCMNSWMQLWVASNRRQFDGGKKCLGRGWILAYTVMSPNKNLQPSRREMEPTKHIIG